MYFTPIISFTEIGTSDARAILPDTWHRSEDERDTSSSEDFVASTRKQSLLLRRATILMGFNLQWNGMQD